jgi:hypothetical protein
MHRPTSGLGRYNLPGGGGQEINTGEAGIGEWIDALNRSFPEWHIHISNRLTDTEYGAGEFLKKIKARPHVSYREDLHLSVSMRSFRAENVSQLVKQILDLDEEEARQTFRQVEPSVPHCHHSGPTGGKEMAQGSCARLRTIWHSCFFECRAVAPSCHSR